MQKFVCSKCVINYTTMGEKGPWVIFSHSLACNLSTWEQEAKLLANDYRVLLFDTRGHGLSSAPNGPYTIDSLADDLIELVDFLEIETFYFIGLSLGGMLGMSIAIRYQHRLHGLCLCDTSPKLSLNATEREATVRREGMESMVGPTIPRFLSKNVIAQAPDVVHTLSDMIRHTSVEGYIGCCHAIAAMDFTEQLTAIDTPTHIIVGDNDSVTPIKDAELIAQKIRGAKLIIINNAGHIVNLEQPEKFHSAIFQFLSRQ